MTNDSDVRFVNRKLAFAPRLVRIGGLNVTPLDLTAPTARLAAATLDELFEAFKVAMHSLRNNTERAADLFHCALGLVIDLRSHSRSICIEPFKIDHPAI